MALAVHKHNRSPHTQVQAVRHHRYEALSLRRQQGSRANNKILFIFDEPTTGLHFHDINKLLASFNALIEQGYSILVIEHNTDVIKSADWMIDLGTEAGDNGGELFFAGKPADLKKFKGSHTAKYL